MYLLFFLCTSRCGRLHPQRLGAGQKKVSCSSSFMDVFMTLFVTVHSSSNYIHHLIIFIIYVHPEFIDFGSIKTDQFSSLHHWAFPLLPIGFLQVAQLLDTLEKDMLTSDLQARGFPRGTKRTVRWIVQGFGSLKGILWQ